MHCVVRRREECYSYPYEAKDCALAKKDEFHYKWIILISQEHAGSMASCIYSAH